MDIPIRQPANIQITQGVAPGGEPLPLSAVAVLLHPNDDVAIARVPLNRGVVLRGAATPERLITVTQRIPSGHKITLRDIEQGQPVRRYGSIIGFATRPVQTGSHVHSHNLAVGELKQEYEYGVDVRPIEYVPVEQRRTFMGYQRPGGKAGTRNYIAIISTVNCSASTVR